MIFLSYYVYQLMFHLQVLVVLPSQQSKMVLLWKLQMSISLVMKHEFSASKDTNCLATISSAVVQIKSFSTPLDAMVINFLKSPFLFKSKHISIFTNTSICCVFQTSMNAAVVSVIWHQLNV